MRIDDTIICFGSHTTSTRGVVQCLYTFSDYLFKLGISRFFAVRVEKFVLEVEINVARERFLLGDFEYET